MTITEIIRLLVTILVSLGFCLFGISLLQKNIRTLAMGSFRKSVIKLFNSPAKATIVSIIFSFVASDAFTIMIISGSLITDGLMTLSSAYGIFLWSNFGLSFTVLFTLIDTKNFTLSILGISLFIYSLTKNNKVKMISGFFVGFSILLYGASLMKSASVDYERVIQLYLTDLISPSSIIIPLIIGVFIRFSSQSTFVVTLMGATFLGMSLLTPTQLIIYYSGTSLIASLLMYILSLNSHRGTLQVFLTQSLYHLVCFILFFSLGILEVFVGNSVFTSTLSQVNQDPVVIASLAMIIYMSIGVVLMIMIKPLALQLIQKLAPPEDTNLFQTKYIDWSSVESPSISLDMVEHESSRIINRFPMYLQMITFGKEWNKKNLEKFFNANEFVLQEIDKFLLEAGKSDLIFEMFQDYILQTQNTHMISSLNKEIYHFCDVILSISDSNDKIRVTKYKFLDSMEFILTTFSETPLYEVNHEHSDHLIALLSPKSSVLEEQRGIIIREQDALNKNDKLKFLDLSLIYERIIWMLRELLTTESGMTTFKKQEQQIIKHWKDKL